MKKAVILFLTFIYLIVASGMAFNFHFCKGKINSVSMAFGQKHEGCCGKKKMTKKKCCDEKIAILKISDNQHSSSSIKTPATTITTIDACYAPHHFSLIKSLETKSITSPHAPPDICQKPIYLQYRILII